MIAQLIRALLRATITPGDGEALASAADLSRRASAKDWTRLRVTLDLHRLGPLVAASFSDAVLAPNVPADLRDWAKGKYRKTLLTNHVLLGELRRLLEALEARGIDPLVMKGIVLADQVLPDLGTRSMGDIDMLVSASEFEVAVEAARELDYQVGEPRQSCVVMCSRCGVTIDLHREFELFDTATVERSARIFQSRSLPGLEYRSFEPNAMLVHLSFHADDHRDETGYYLRWLMDMAFLVGLWGDELEPDRMRALCPSAEVWRSLLRTLRFLAVEVGLALPAPLEREASAARPYDLGYVLRGRRVTPWRLDTVRGWGALTASWLGVHDPDGRALPGPADLLLRPIDLLSDRRELR